MKVKKDRVIIEANEIKEEDGRKIPGARFYKKAMKWSFPIEHASMILSQCKKTKMENEWYDIFPEFKFLLEW